MNIQDCAYCMAGDLLAAFGYPCIELDETKVYIFKEQSHKGRVIVASKHHVSELTALSDDQRNAFFADVAKVAKAQHAAFGPDKVNYGAYGDSGHHLHFHLVPKYKDEFEWNAPFAMNPEKTFLSNEEYEALAEAIRNHMN